MSTHGKSDIVIVSNRLPVNRVKQGRGSQWQTSPGGLVSALTPILQDRPSTWVGWAGSAGTTVKPFVHDGIHNVPVKISRDELAGYYDGFSNRTLWPLYHDAIRPPEYHRRWWWPYVEINRRFAEAAAEWTAEGGTLWVQDYHLQLAPAMIRERRPDVKIGFFLHIPFPPQELFAQLPWRSQLLEGMLGADVVGFQTKLGAQNFFQLCRRFVHGVGGRSDAIEHNGREVQARAYPISIDTRKFGDLAASPEIVRRADALKSRLGHDRKIILGVDRMDYTKGIDIRLRAYQELLRSERRTTSECVFVQVGVPSRERVADYQEIRSDIEGLIGQIAGEFGEVGRIPVHYLHRNLPIDELVALYLAADVMVVTPLRDGMNLVAKEYVATRTQGTGVLLLSEFAGAANELRTALLVNPHDIDGLERSIDRALGMELPEQRRRMRAMQRVVRQSDVYGWAHRFLEDLTR